MRNIIPILIFVCLCFACTNNKQNADNAIDNIVIASDSANSILYYEQFLGRNIDSIPQISNYRKENKIESGDEGESWKSLSFSADGKNILTMETNWADTVHISRITIVSDKIRMGSVFVGQPIKSFKNDVRYSLEPSSDGYMLLQLDEHKNIHLQMDISNVPQDSPLWLGECSVNDTPDSLCIESVILSKE